MCEGEKATAEQAKEEAGVLSASGFSDWTQRGGLETRRLLILRDAREKALGGRDLALGLGLGWGGKDR